MEEILVKAVIQLVPTYAMNLFRLPHGIIKEVEKMCARFWWGGSQEIRKIHWGGWNRLCKPKRFRGLGFKDLAIFNKAMLADFKKS